MASRIYNGDSFRCILADPPWELSLSNQRARARSLPYPTMTVSDICSMNVGVLAAENCHLWLWTTNQHLADGFEVMKAWGFKYLAPIHWIKPSGIGCWFAHRTQTLLFGYRRKCVFNKARYRPNLFFSGNPKRHSQKPSESYDYIESVSGGPRLEIFARGKRDGWKVYGNEVESDLEIARSGPLPR